MNENGNGTVTVTGQNNNFYCTVILSISKRERDFLNVSGKENTFPTVQRSWLFLFERLEKRSETVGNVERSDASRFKYERITVLRYAL